MSKHLSFCIRVSFLASLVLTAPHTASLAAGVLIAQLRAVAFSHHIVLMRRVAQVPFECEAPGQTRLTLKS